MHLTMTTRRKGHLPVLTRTVGCWNCLSWSPEQAKARWKTKRQEDLETAVAIALDHPQGEQATRVVNIRRMVASVDNLIAAGQLGTCIRADLPRETPIGDFVAHGYLCNYWDARQGASIAREGQKLDKTSDEIFADHLADVEKG